MALGRSLMVCVLASCAALGDAKFLAASLPRPTRPAHDVAALLLDGASGATARRGFVQRSIARTLAAMPRTREGKLDAPAARHVVRGYFAREHGWQIGGLLGSGSSRSEGSELPLGLKLVRLLAEGQSLSVEELVTTIVALEGVIAADISELLDEAYYEVGVERDAEGIGSGDMLRILTQYLHFVRQGGSSLVPSKIRVSAEAVDALRNFDFKERHSSNPFVSKSYSFEKASKIAVELAHDFGRIQNEECIVMKDHLVSLDLHGTGRVPLDVFHKAEPGAFYAFSESAEYLDQIGALDMTKSPVPMVRITNYLLGPGNCIPSSQFYSVCCINECEVMMSEIEGHVRSPRASVEFLLSVVQNVSDTLDIQGHLTPSLIEKLIAVAERNSGNVPIHGRLFAQWLHFAFPNECPFPAHIDDEWYAKGSVIASAEERKQYVDVADNITEMLRAPNALEQWSDEETLLFYPAEDGWKNAWFHAGKSLAQLALFVGAIGGSIGTLAFPFVRRMATSQKNSFKDHYV